jgi:hypothetical protein
MIGQLLFTLFLVAMVVEAGREAYGTAWASRHFTRMMLFTATNRPPRDFWTERKTRSEKWAHRRHWHIDLLSRSSIKNPKK